MSTRAVTQRVRELLELALLLLLGSQFLLGRVRGRLHARRALRLEGLGTLGLAAIRQQRLAFLAARVADRDIQLFRIIPMNLHNRRDRLDSLLRHEHLRGSTESPSLSRIDGVATPPPDLASLLERVREGRPLQ